MTIADINSLVSFRANTNTTQYTAPNRLISINRWYHKIVTMILDSQDEWDFDDSNQTDYPESTTSLLANQQDYTFPGSLKMLKIKRVEAKINGTDWKRVNPIDINQIGNATDTTSIANDFDATAPYYDSTANSIKLYPIPTSNVTGGLKIWFSREPVEFTAAEVTTGTKEPGFEEPWHVMIALGMIYDFGSSIGAMKIKQDAMTELEEYELRLRRFYGSKQKDRQIALTAAYINYN